MSISGSFVSSGLYSSSATSVSNILQQWGNSPIASCVLGISSIGMKSKLSYNLAHSALLLLQKEIDYEVDEEEMQNEKGIIIEYGDYSPKMSKDELICVEKGFVKYHYNDKGGLRYYVINYRDFIKNFGEIGYIDLNIEVENQKTFNSFIEKIANLEDNRWIQANYSVGFLNNFNCQTFALEALRELKPYFNMANVYPADEDLAKKKSRKKLDFVPKEIKDEIMNYYKN